MKQPDAKWLHDMAREVAETPAPDVDWAKVEQHVFEAIEQPGRPLRFDRPASPWPRVAAIAAIAAGVALAVTSTTTRSVNLAPSHASLTVAPSQPLEVDAQGLTRAEAGTVLVASAEPVLVQHRDWARFRLTPNSRVAIERIDDRIDLRLIEGKVEAMVTKRGLEDIFTVRVDQMRVSVHGTVFSVARDGGIMHVHVQRGSVAVGPVRRNGSTEGWLVTAPSTGTFSIDDQVRLSVNSQVPAPISFPSLEPAESAVETIELAAEAPAGTPAIARTEPARKPEHSGARAEEPVLPDTLTPSLAASTLASIASQVSDCYQRSLPVGDDSVTIHVQTTVHIRVAADGHVVFARFDPPLSPSAQACASAVVQSASFPKARDESQLTLPLSL